MVIPEQYKRFCENPEIKILFCEFYVTPECPETCYLSNRLKQGISHTALTGLERFIKKFPNWREKSKYGLGIGALVELPKGMKNEQ